MQQIVTTNRIKKISARIKIVRKKFKKMQNPGIDPGTSRMQSGRSTI